MTDRTQDAVAVDATTAPAPAARPPVKAPEGAHASEAVAAEKDAPETTPAVQQQRKPVKIFGVKMPGPVSNTLHSMSDWGSRWRKGAIEKTPGFIVNHSPNFIGAVQIVSEGLMFRSSGMHLVRPKIDLKNPENNRKWYHYISDPPTNIVEGVFKKAKFDVKAGNLLDKEFYKESFGALKDLEKATLRDRTDVARMTNKWSARSGFAGLCAMGVSMIWPSEKNTPEETEHMTKLAKEHPVKYAGTRVYQALNPLEWHKHKRQFSGFGMGLAGLFSFISGFRQVEGKFTDEMIKAGMKNPQRYMSNPWQMAGGLITLIGGTQLMMAVDNDKGWRNFGVIQILRLGTLPNSIMTRFKKEEQGAEWYLGAQGMLQAKNVLAASIGGAEKRPDGTIVDHAKIRADALVKTKKEIAERKAKKHSEHEHEHAKADAVAADEMPSAKVTAAADVALAMPERVAPEAIASV